MKRSIKNLLPRKHAFVQQRGIKDRNRYRKGLDFLFNSTVMGGKFAETAFVGDYLITWNRNLSFLRDPYFQKIMDSENERMKRTIWRLYLLQYFARASSLIDGDFLEVGCYRRDTASVVIDEVDFTVFGTLHQVM